MTDLSTALGPLELRTPLIGAAGTVGSVVDFSGVADLSAYGAAVAKSVSEDPWKGRPAPRVAPSGLGMLNSIGIQNPGIDAWIEEVGPHLAELPVPVWGSAVGRTAGEFARVAAKLEAVGVQAIEINLSCPNLEGHGMFALDPGATREVVASVRRAVCLPIGAKLSPNAEDITAIGSAAVEAGADWLVLTNTVWGAGIDVRTRRPLLSGLIGGYSGPPLKPIALRCVLETRRSLPDTPIVGCGGVTHGEDVIEFLLAGASAVCVGTAHLDRPRTASTLLREVESFMREQGVTSLRDYIGKVEPW
jgi:dihydroorotate dehydrogenase (NAD+) catalytic subunit